MLWSNKRQSFKGGGHVCCCGKGSGVIDGMGSQWGQRKKEKEESDIVGREVEKKSYFTNIHINIHIECVCFVIRHF